MLVLVLVESRGERRAAHSSGRPAFRWYRAEVVATDLTTPIHCTFADDGACYVVHCGFTVEQRPRILRIDLECGASETDSRRPIDAARPAVDP